MKNEKRKKPSAQRSIPIDKLYRDGIIKCGSMYSKSWRFSDVNYDVASDDDKEQMFLMHSAILNGLPTDAFTKISIYNRTLGNEVIKQMVSSSGAEEFEQYKRELVDLLHSKMEESNSIVHDKYITVSTEKKNIEEVKSLFTRVCNDLTADFARLGSKITQIVVAAVKALVSAIAALGWWALVILVVIIIICIMASVIASPFGIFISDEAADPSSIPVSSIIAECNMELSEKLTEKEDSTPHHSCVVEGEQADWKIVLSVFAVKIAGTDDNTAQDVVVIDEVKKEKLKTVFWDMHTITSRTEMVTVGELTRIILYITIDAKTKDEMILKYFFGIKQKEALETLLENGDAFTGTMQSLTVSDAKAKEILENLPEDLSEERKLIVKKACSLVGKVTYFWGGKSSAIGWDSEWGKMKTVTAAGSVTTGKTRPFGLCHLGVHQRRILGKLHRSRRRKSSGKRYAY